MKRYTTILVLFLFSFGYIQTTSNQQTLKWFEQTKQRVKHINRIIFLVFFVLQINFKFLIFRMSPTIEVLCWFMLHIHASIASTFMGTSIRELYLIE